MIEAIIATAGAGSGGLVAAAGPIGAAVEGFQLATLGQPSQLANVFTSKLQTPLGPKLAAISQLVGTDPVTAQQNLITTWRQFLLDSGAFIDQTYPEGGIIVQQALSTQSLIQTVDTLAKQSGLSGGLPQLNGIISAQDPPVTTGGAIGLGVGIGVLVRVIPELVAGIKGLANPNPSNASLNTGAVGSGGPVSVGNTTFVGSSSNAWVLIALAALMIFLILAFYEVNK